MSLIIVIGAVYRPRGSNVALLNKLNDFMYELRVQHKNVIVGVDLNLPDLDWNKLLPMGREHESAASLIDVFLPWSSAGSLRLYSGSKRQ